MPNSWICIDANLVVRLVIDAGDTTIIELVERSKEEGRRLAAPGLLYYEVTNALYQYQRHGYFGEETVRLALIAAQSLPLELFGDGDLHSAALRLAQQLSLPAIYDAHYLALAERFDAELWTADRRLARAVQGEVRAVRLVQGD